MNRLEIDLPKLNIHISKQLQDFATNYSMYIANYIVNNADLFYLHLHSSNFPQLTTTASINGNHRNNHPYISALLNGTGIL